MRAKIEKRDSKTLVITEIPFGKTTGSPSRPSQFIDSILKAAEKGKIKVRKVEDMTASGVEILIHLMPGASSDKTIDALYACTDCEISISPNCCVIDGQKPCFLSVSDVLRKNVDTTLSLLRQERLIRKGELLEGLHFASLERIFIENRIYKDKKFEQAEDMEQAIAHVDSRLEPFKKDLVREVTRDDILRLMEIKMARILKFNSDKAEEHMLRIREEVARIDAELSNMVEVTCDWFRFIKDKYGASHPRLTEIKNFDTIVANKVVEANQKLYINRAEGFIGTGLKKDEFICNCSDIDDVILFYRDGTYKVVHIADKLFVGETEVSRQENKRAELIHVAIFKKNDSRTIYNVVYRDGKGGNYLMKRFNVTTIKYDHEFNLTKGTKESRVVYFTANPNGEAEVIKVTLKPMPKLKRIFFDKDFSEVAIRGRQAMGVLLTKLEVSRITLKSHGTSTLGGRKVWFDPDIKRLNYDEQGLYLGEFGGEDRILVIQPNGDFYLTTIDLNNHFEGDIMRMEIYQPDKVWTAVLFDEDQHGYLYVKRFLMEATTRHQNFLGENPKNRLMCLTDVPYPRMRVTLGGTDEFRDPLELDVESFVGVKGFKAKGKRATVFEVNTVEELEPLHQPAPDKPAESNAEETPEEPDPYEGKTQRDVADEINGQLHLFDD